jgi:hypothetical protein
LGALRPLDLKTLLPVGLAFLVVSGAATATEPVYVTDFGQARVAKMSAQSMHENRDDADHYALASKLAVLKEGDPDELRLWVSWATFDPSTNGIATVGYVFAGNHARMCRIAYPGQSTSPKSGLCRRYAPQVGPAQIASDLARLSALADVSIDCNVVDGDWVLIDAISNGKRFVLSASNPHTCTGDAAKLVSEVLSEVAEPSR